MQSVDKGAEWTPECRTEQAFRQTLLDLNELPTAAA